MLIRMKKAQSTAEYAILFSVILAALAGMQVYMKRSFNAKMKDSADLLTRVSGTVGGVKLNTTNQYEPYYTNQSVNTTYTEDSTTKKYQDYAENYERNQTYTASSTYRQEGVPSE